VEKYIKWKKMKVKRGSLGWYSLILLHRQEWLRVISLSDFFCLFEY